MASVIDNSSEKKAAVPIKSIKPDLMEKILGGLALMLLAAAVIALVKGYSQWNVLPWQVWLHLVTLLTALVITPVMLWRKRGDGMHRKLGWIWSIAMFATAVISFDIRGLYDANGGYNGSFSLIHLLSVLTVIVVPLLVLAARRHDVVAHRKHVRGIVMGALLIAGFFSFPFNRIMGQWLFG